MTRTGMCCAYSSAASTTSRSPIAVDELLAVVAGGRLDLVDGLRREGGEQQAAGRLVERRVGRDGRRDARRRQLARRAERRRHDAAGGEALGVVGDLGHVVVAWWGATRRRSARCGRPGSPRCGARPRSGTGRRRTPRRCGRSRWPSPARAGGRHCARRRSRQSSSIVMASSGQLATASRAWSSSPGATVPSPIDLAVAEVVGLEHERGERVAAAVALAAAPRRRAPSSSPPPHRVVLAR